MLLPHLRRQLQTSLLRIKALGVVMVNKVLMLWHGECIDANANHFKYWRGWVSVESAESGNRVARYWCQYGRMRDGVRMGTARLECKVFSCATPAQDFLADKVDQKSAHGYHGRWWSELAVARAIAAGWNPCGQEPARQGWEVPQGQTSAPSGVIPNVAITQPLRKVTTAPVDPPQAPRDSNGQARRSGLDRTWRLEI